MDGFTNIFGSNFHLSDLEFPWRVLYLAAMKSAIWISYDLGVRGDYESLYAWLDDHDAQECGDSLAFLNFQHAGSLIASVKRDIKRSIQITRNARIYLIYRDSDTKKIKGIFLFGGRKAPPWTGYGSPGGKVMDVDES